MSSHPLNLTLRFLLEITSLISAGIWGYNQTENWIRFLLAAAIPVIMAVLWGIVSNIDLYHRFWAARPFSRRHWLWLLTLIGTANGLLMPLLVFFFLKDKRIL